MSSVGQALGGLIGAVAGFFMGGPAGALKGFSLGASIGGMLDPPKGPNQTGPRLTDLSAQTSTYGTPIPRIYGTVATLGNIFWIQGDKLTEVATVSKQKSGKGGGGKATTTTYSYFATFAVGLCQGEIEGVRRIWIGSKLIYDAGSDNLESVIASNQAASGFKVYTGAETQTADPRMQADKGAANVPGYRGLAYIVFYDLALADFGNSLLGAQVKVEVIKSGSSNAFAAVGSTDVLLSGGVPGIKWTADASDFEIARSQSSASGTGVVIRYVLNSSVIIPRTIENDGGGGVAYFIYAVNGCEGVAYYFSFGTKIYIENGPTLQGMTSAEVGGFGRSIQKRNDWYFLQLRNDTGTKDIVLAFAPGRPDAIAYRVESATGYYASVSGDFCWDLKVVTSSATGGVIYANVYDDSLSLSKTVSVAYSGVEFGLGLGALMLYAPMYALNGKGYYLSSNGAHCRLVEIDFDSESVAYWDLPNLGLTEYPRALKVYGHGDFIQVMTTGNPLAGSASVLTFNKKISSETESLASIISTECEGSGLLGASDIDVTSLTDEVRGYRIAETGAIRAALEPLQGAFPFDVTQAGYQIKFIPRGTASVATISSDELGAVAVGDKPAVQITSSREMDSQLPRRVAIKYFDNVREYDISEQYAERLNTDAVNLLDMQLPIVLTATEAAGVAEKLLYLYWLERYSVSFTLPMAYAYLEPADVITITSDNGTLELRIAQINYTSNGLVECQAKYNNNAVYVAAAIGEEGLSTGADIVFKSASLYVLLDIPCLQDQFNVPGFAAAMCGYSTTWPGGVIFKSSDEGQTWLDVQGFTGAVPIGFATTVLATGRNDIVDSTNTLTLALLSGELSSVTQAQMLNGSNYFAIGAHGRWEIVAAQNCVLNVDGTYTLSDFLRGRFGTEWAMTSHAIGDAVVYLNDADLAFVGTDTAAIGAERIYRGITAGADIDSDSDLSFTYAGVNLECLSPVYLNGSIHPSTRDWTLTWIRRTRIDGALRNYVDAALGETVESYEFDIYADNTYAVVKRTLTSATPTVAYTSAQQTTDFGGNQTTLYVKVYQLSATVGRGYPLTTSITRA